MSAISWRNAARSSVGIWMVALVATACTTPHPKADEPPALSPAPVVSSQVDSPAPASSSVPAQAVLPAGCPHLLPLGVVEQALGGPLFGEVTYLRAAPVPKSGRTGRVTCGYGTSTDAPDIGVASPAASPTPAGDPLVSASYITYTDAATAASRVALTVQTDGASSTVSKVDVGGLEASVLLGPKWNELVMSDGARTIVVEAAPRVLPNAQAPAALTAMAKVMLQFGAPPASASASAAVSPAGG